jgi:hypothetical protein
MSSSRRRALAYSKKGARYISHDGREGAKVARN